jgi:hypothetical protein
MSLTQVYKGAGTAHPIFKKYGNIFYDQTNLGLPLCNLKSGKVWAGAATSKALLTIVGAKAFMGASTSNCIYNYQKGIVFKGASTEEPLYKVVGNNLYQGASTSKIMMNWTGTSLSVSDIFAAITLLKTRY